MVRLLWMGRSSQTRLVSPVTSMHQTTVINARLMPSLERRHALATTQQVGARMLGATSTLATAMTQMLVCQITSARHQMENLCTIHMPLATVQMDTILQSAQPSQLQPRALPTMNVLGLQGHVQCRKTA